ncbi:MAG TPA: sulfatase-like hydrolase/transferase [Draconibacterium sp.]|nr:sulfatase-like hydrolase/transferase [Draconibacterium sp.]
MSNRNFDWILVLLSVLLLNTGAKAQKDLPNILWIVSEDNSAYFTGCYGNSFATTPNIDKLASEGFLYSHAYCPSAVCAPSRNAILTGNYASTNGNENMRSDYAKSSRIKTYPEYLREAGYYCTNNSKTDYNTNSVDPNKIWDESSDKAHYKNRPEGKPFFAVFNSMISHESCMFRIIPYDKLRHNPEKVPLPPYHPNTKEVKHDWAQYYDCIEDMDSWVATLLKELDDEGLADNTIVFYYGDNGGVLPRSKRFLYETGTQIPLVIRIPEKYKSLFPAEKPGEKIDRLVNFPDLLPTLLSIAGIQVPENIDGQAFLGDQKTKDPEYTFFQRQRMDERFDHVRAVRDQKYRYIRNYMPFRINMQHLAFLFNEPSAQSWEAEFRAGRTNAVQSRAFLPKPVEELYDVENDPWEVNNLANDPKYADVLKRMRGALDQWRKKTKDVGVIPELEYNTLAGDTPLYDYVRSAKCDYEKLRKASDLAVLGSVKDIDTYIKYLQDENSAIRYWGATGILVHKDQAKSAVPALKKAVNETSVQTAVLEAEALAQLGEKEIAQQVYLHILNDDKSELLDRAFVLNSIDAIDFREPEVEKWIKDFYDEKSKNVKGFAIYSQYDISLTKSILEKWGVIEKPTGGFSF